MEGGRKLVYPEEIHESTGKTFNLHAGRILDEIRTEQQGGCANHLATFPHIPNVQNAQLAHQFKIEC